MREASAGAAAVVYDPLPPRSFDPLLETYRLRFFVRRRRQDEAYERQNHEQERRETLRGEPRRHGADGVLAMQIIQYNSGRPSSTKGAIKRSTWSFSHSTDANLRTRRTAGAYPRREANLEFSSPSSPLTFSDLLSI